MSKRFYFSTNFVASHFSSVSVLKSVRLYDWFQPSLRGIFKSLDFKGQSEMDKNITWLLRLTHVLMLASSSTTARGVKLEVNGSTLPFHLGNPHRVHRAFVATMVRKYENQSLIRKYQTWIPIPEQEAALSGYFST
jgi:hypothetical protein